MNDNSGVVIGGGIVFVICLLVGLVIGAMWGLPKYGVYKQRLAGEAELANAEYSRQVAVREAIAQKDSAVLLAQAEVERAQGVAKANKIIGDSLNKNESYLYYLYINDLAHTKNQVIYVPTSGGMPVLEASRLSTFTQPQASK